LAAAFWLFSVDKEEFEIIERDHFQTPPESPASFQQVSPVLSN
jgi:hypothetical protein